MPKTSPAGWLLTRITGRERAAAIMGYLLEISATRNPRLVTDRVKA